MLLTRSNRSKARRGIRQPRYQIRWCEELEGRCLLAQVFWDGEAGDSLWTTGQNWSGNQAPGPADDVVIDVVGNTTVVLRGNLSIKSLVNAEALWVQGSNSGGHSSLTIAGNVTNHGTLRMESIDSGWHSTVSILGGTFTNASDGTIQVRGGTGGARQISGSVTNQGSLDVQAGATLISQLAGGGSFAHAAGTTTVGGMLQIHNGLVQFTGGAMSGSLSFINSRFEAAGQNLQGTVIGLNSQIDLAVGLPGVTTFIMRGTSTLSGQIGANHTVWVQGSDSGGNSSLTMASDVTNHGTLRMESIDSGWHTTVSILGGTLTNASDGTIQVQAGSGGARQVNGSLTNHGSLDVQAGATLVSELSGASFIQAAGTTTAGGMLQIQNGLVQFTGGSISGNLSLGYSRFEAAGQNLQGTVIGLNSQIDLAVGLPGATTFIMRGTSTLSGQIGANHTVWVQGSNTVGGSSLTIVGNVTNHGTLRMESIDNAWSSTVTVSGGTFTNASDGTFQVRAGTGGARQISGSVTNQGSLDVQAGATLISELTHGSFVQAAGTTTVGGMLQIQNGLAQFTGGSISGRLSFINSRFEAAGQNLSGTVIGQSSQIDLAVGLPGVTTFIMRGTSTLSGQIGANHTVWVQGKNTVGSSSLTIAGNVTNHGTLRMESIDDAWSSTVTVSGGTFTNASDGTIQVRAGTGGARQVNGSLTNHGSLDVQAGATLISQLAGGGSFAHVAGTTTVGGMLQIHNGLVQFTGGTISGTVVGQNSQIDLAVGLPGVTTFIMRGTSTLSGQIGANHTVWVQGSDSGGNSSLTIAGNVTNRGTLRMESIDAAWFSTVTVLGGTFTNASDGTIQVRAGTGGARQVNGSLTNHGSLDVQAGATLVSELAGGASFIQAAGTTTVGGTLQIQNGLVQFTGGSISGNLSLGYSRFEAAGQNLSGTVLGHYSQIDLAVGLPGVASFITRGASTLSGQIGANHTVWVQGSNSGGSSSLSMAGNVTNHGTLRMESIDGGWHSTATVLGGTLTNASDGTIQVRAGTGGERSLSGSVVNLGAIVAESLQLNGSISNHGSITMVRGGVVDVNTSLSLTGNGLIASEPATTLSVSDNLTGSTANKDQFAVQGRVQFDGGRTSLNPQLLEVMADDQGNVAAGFVDNFVYGRMELANSSYVRLVDQFDNVPGGIAESLYVNALVVPSGSTLDLNGLHMYARGTQISGTILGGTVNLIADGGPLPFNTPALGRISVLGEHDDWTFHGRAGDAVTVTLDPGTTALPPTLNFGQVQLIDPQNNVISLGSSSASGAAVTLAGIALPTSGTYRIRVSAAPLQSVTGFYSIAAYDASIDEVPLILNQQHNGTIETRYSIDRWTFSAVAGQQIRFDLINTSSNAALSYQLQGPNSATLFAGIMGDSQLITLVDSGSYVLSVDAATGQPGSYVFRMQETSVTPLQVGATYHGILPGSDFAQLFRFSVSDPTRLVLSFDDVTTTNRNELYARLGAPPTRSDYHFRSTLPAAADQQLVIPSAQAGEWYVLLYGESVGSPSSFTLLVQDGELFVTHVTPDHGATNAPFTLTITGAGFDGTTSLALVSASGTSVVPNSLHVDLPTQLTATFAVGTVLEGTYTVRAEEPGGIQATHPDAITIVAIGEPQLETNLVLPAALARRGLATLYVEWANRGNVAMPAPLLLLRSGDPDDSDKPLLTLDSNRIAAGFWTSGNPDGFSHAVQILGSGSTPGVLQPGETGRVPVYYAGLQTNTFDSAVEFQLYVAAIDDPTPIDWATLKDGLRPSDVLPEAWDRIYANIVAQTGSTWGEYARMLNENAMYLGGLGHQVTDIDRLWQFEVRQANDLAPLGPLAPTVDAAVPAIGLELGLGRSFAPNISGRFSRGAFGRGWSTPWQVFLTFDTDGSVTLNSATGDQRRFQPDVLRTKLWSHL